MNCRNQLKSVYFLWGSRHISESLFPVEISNTFLPGFNMYKTDMTRLSFFQKNADDSFSRSLTVLISVRGPFLFSFIVCSQSTFSRKAFPQCLWLNVIDLQWPFCQCEKDLNTSPLLVLENYWRLVVHSLLGLYLVQLWKYIFLLHLQDIETICHIFLACAEGKL